MEEVNANAHQEATSCTREPCLVNAIKRVDELKENAKNEFIKSLCESASCELKKYDDEQMKRRQDEDNGLPQEFVQDKRMSSLNNFLSQFTSKEYEKFQRLLVSRVMNFAYQETCQKFHKEQSPSELDPELMELMKCDERVEREAMELLAKTVSVSNEIKTFMKLMLGDDSEAVVTQLKTVYEMNSMLPKDCDFTYQLSVMGHLFFIRRHRIVTQEVANLLFSVFDFNDRYLKNRLKSSGTPCLSNLLHIHHIICSLFLFHNRQLKKRKHLKMPRNLKSHHLLRLLLMRNI